MRLSAVAITGLVAAACAPKVVEKIVKETVIVAGTPQVVEKVVKETVIVEKAAPEAVKVLTFGRHWSIDFRGQQEAWDIGFMDRHPEVVIKRTYNTWSEHNRIVPTWAAAGEMPDIIYVHGRYAFPWNHEGIVVSMQDYVESDTEFNVGGIWPEALRLYNYQGKQYEIPYDHGPLVLAYNKDIFDEAGLAYPDETWTMDDLLEAAKKLTDPSKPQWGFETNLSILCESGAPHVGPWGGRVFNDDDTKILVNSPECITAMNFWVGMIHDLKVSPTSAESASFPGGSFQAGGVIAMTRLASWSTPGMHMFATFDWDVDAWPAGPAGRKTGSFGSGFGITRDSKQADLCWSYIREYLSVEGMEFMWGESGRGSPARKAAYQSWMDSEIAPENAEAYLDALANYAVTGRPYQTLAGGEIGDVINRHTDLLMTGDMSVEEALAGIEKEGNPILEEAEKRLKG